MTTNIYIDVDGVINSFHKSKTAGWEGDWKLKKVIGYPIHWYTDLVVAINSWNDLPDVNVKWLTTWRDQAVSDLCPALGIEGTEWEVIQVPEGQVLFDRRDWWKFHAIKADIEKTTPDKVVWIDDDFKYERNAISWAEDNKDLVLAVSPFTDWGMTKEEFDGIIEFINA